MVHLRASLAILASALSVLPTSKGRGFQWYTSGQIVSILASALQVVHLRLTTHHSSISTESLLGYDSRNSVSHKWALRDEPGS